MNSISSLRILPADTEPAGALASSKGASEFTDTLAEAMHTVDTLHDAAQTQVESLLQGNGADVHSAMIAVEKAELSFELMMQVRNKIVQAYQQVSSMQF